MLNYNKFIELLISLQTIIISMMIPVFITSPYKNKINFDIDLSITWQIPLIILLTLIFKSKIVLKAFTIYLFLGLFVLPVFHQGGSLGYLLTPNFGYLIGIYPLIKIIDKYKKKDLDISMLTFLKYGISAITIMHLVGIIYIIIQMINFNQSNLIIYYIAKFSLGKFCYHILMLIPITILLRTINKIKFRN